MSDPDEPFELHRAHPVARRVVTTVVFTFGGALGTALLLAYLLSEARLLSDLDSGIAQMMFLVSAVSGGVLGLIFGLRFDFKKFDKNPEKLFPTKPLDVSKLEPIELSKIRKEGDKFLVGKREFSTMKEAESFIYHINIQRELLRNARK